jgi:hypothetical protein
MPLTHDFKETIRARAQREPKFRQALLREAVESYLTGDLASALSRTDPAILSKSDPGILN